MAVILSGVIAGLVLWCLSPRSKQARFEDQADSEGTRFLIRDGMVLDHRIAPGCPQFDTDEPPRDWKALRAKLSQQFAGLPIDLESLKPGHPYTFHAAPTGDTSRLRIETVTRGHLIVVDAPTPSSTDDTLACQTIRDALNSAPDAIFSLDTSGGLSWANAAFLQFPEAERTALLEAIQQNPDQALYSHAITHPDTGRVSHLEIRCTSTDQGRVCHMTDITRVVEADRVRTAFVQTLTKTFANLSTGLAVFDRRQRLMLFNPAMLDLTGLPVDFLSSQPQVLEFFDRLRDAQVMPEPKDYADWRRQTKTMLKTAADGEYLERWSLPDGRSYQVTGRPHPDGAIAFLIEDVSDEMSTTRRTRRQLDIRQAVLDQITDAIAVFGPDQTLVFCNQAFAAMLGLDPDRSLVTTSLQDLPLDTSGLTPLPDGFSMLRLSSNAERLVETA